MVSRNKEILDRFFEDPDSVYKTGEELSSEDRKSIMQAEEFLISSMVEERLSPERNHLFRRDEEELSWLVDMVYNGVSEPEAAAMLDAEPGMDAAVGEMAFAIKSMESEKKPVPGYLMDMVRSSNAKVAGRVPAIMIRIAEDGLHVIKSALQGFIGLPVAAVTVRASAAVQEKTNRIELIQNIGEDEETFVHYEIVSEGNRSVTLGLQIPQSNTDFRVNLRQDGRLVDARLVNKGEQTALTFDHLTPGHYEIEIKGGLNRTFPIFIEEV
jgi:hypothetical protein